MRVREVDFQPCECAHRLVIPELFALVVCQCLTEVLGNPFEDFAESFQCRSGAGTIQFDQKDHSSGAFRQSSHSRAIPGTDNQVAFPVARIRKVFHFGGMLVDADHVRNLPAMVLALGSRATYLPVLPQAADQFLAQESHRHRIQGGVNGLVRHRESPSRWVEPLEESGYLL